MNTRCNDYKGARPGQEMHYPSSSSFGTPKQKLCFSCKILSTAWTIKIFHLKYYAFVINRFDSLNFGIESPSCYLFVYINANFSTLNKIKIFQLIQLHIIDGHTVLVLMNRLCKIIRKGLGSMYVNELRNYEADILANHNCPYVSVDYLTLSPRDSTSSSPMH